MEKEKNTEKLKEKIKESLIQNRKNSEKMAKIAITKIVNDDKSIQERILSKKEDINE